MGGSYSLCAQEDVLPVEVNDGAPTATLSDESHWTSNPQQSQLPGEQQRNTRLAQQRTIERPEMTSPSTSQSMSITSGSLAGSKRCVPTRKAALLLPMSALPLAHSDQHATNSAEISSAVSHGAMDAATRRGCVVKSDSAPNPLAELPIASFLSHSSPKGAAPISPQVTATDSSSTVQSMILQGEEPERVAHTHRASVAVSHSSHHAPQSVDLERVHGSFVLGTSVSTMKSAADPELQPSHWESWGTECSEGRGERQQRRIATLLTNDLQSPDGM